MRQIERSMVNALINGRTFKSANTEVYEMFGDLYVALHGNDIARVNKDGSLEISAHGWRTTTTKSRLNALLQGFGFESRICQINYQWFITNRTDKTPFDTRRGQWTKITL